MDFPHQPLTLTDQAMSVTKTRFTDRLIEANGMDPGDFKAWVFTPGMLFRAPGKWWGDFGRRDFPHEGLDFCLYRNAAGQVRRLGGNTHIPVMHDGRVRALFTDYLGQAVVIEHDSIPGLPEKAISIYAHTNPREGILPGVDVGEGDIIASIADTSHSKANILPHLHFSFGRPSPDIVYEPFVWNQMRDPDLVTLHDPQSLVEWPSEVLDLQLPDKGSKEAIAGAP
jgi:murein DD-endopeptidase MepM/ murein hydrolase activator NlpD